MPTGVLGTTRRIQLRTWISIECIPIEDIYKNLYERIIYFLLKRCFFTITLYCSQAFKIGSTDRPCQSFLSRRVVNSCSACRIIWNTNRRESTLHRSCTFELVVVYCNSVVVYSAEVSQSVRFPQQC